MLKTTPLHALHRVSGARMVDFGGWEMPLHYGSQIEEHHAVRNDAGVFDVSHMQVVDIEGGGARAFLRFALANNVDKLNAIGRALYSCLLTEEGGVVDDLIVYFFREDYFRLVVNAGSAEKDLAWLAALRQRLAQGAAAAHAEPDREVRITPRRDLALIAIQGPKAREHFWRVEARAQAATEPLMPFSATFVGEIMVARTGYTGEDGFEIALPAAQAERLWKALIAAHVRPCGLGARDTLRVEAGMNLYGQDMDEQVSPLDAGLGWSVDLGGERDFMGKSALRLDGKRHEFLGLMLLEHGGVLRTHQKVLADGGEGEVTSGTFSPTLAKSIALSRLPRGTAPGDTVRVKVRDKALTALVVKPPFVRRGKILVPAIFEGIVASPHSKEFS